MPDQRGVARFSDNDRRKQKKRRGRTRWGQICPAFGKNFSPERFMEICAGLEERHLVVVKKSPAGQVTTLNNFSVSYRILFRSYL